MCNTILSSNGWFSSKKVHSYAEENRGEVGAV